jgi:hypothetical protein
MANGVNIPIVVTANTAGAQQATTALQGTAAAASQAGQALSPTAGNPWVTASRGLAQVQQQAQQAAPAVASVGQAAERAAGKPGVSGHGMLLLGQAIEDAQYGLRGVMNNIPGVVMSFGLGAGAAGVLQIGLVALSQVLNVLGKQTKELAATGLLTDLGFDDEQTEKARKFSEALRGSSEASDNARDRLRELKAATDALLEAQQKLLEMRRELEDEDFVPSDDPIADAARKKEEAMRRLDEDQALARQQRLGELTAVEGEANITKESAAEAAAAAAEQQRVVEGIAARDAKAARAAQLEKEINKNTAYAAGPGSLPDPISNPKAFLERIGREVFGDQSREDAARQAAQQLDEYQKLREDMDKLPTLPGFKPTGDAKADQEQRQQLFQEEQEKLRALERQAREKADAAAETERKAQLQRQLFGTEEETAGLEREIKTRRLEKTFESDVDKANAAEKAAQQQQAQAAGNEAITQAVAGLDELAAQAKNDQMRDAIAELRATLTDADGATAEDVQRIQQYLASLQTGNSEAQKAIAGTLAAMAQAQQSFVGEINSLRAQVEQLRTSVNSMR